MWTRTGKKSYPPRETELTIPAGGKPGQILVRTALGVEWKDNEHKSKNLVANLTYDSAKERYDVYKCDKSIDEINNALDAGSDVEMWLDGLKLHYSYTVGSGYLRFSEIKVSYDDEITLYLADYSRDNLFNVYKYTLAQQEQQI